jgi:AcrR family transcriptional regulator
MKLGRPVIHTKAVLLDHALRLSQTHGYNKLTRVQLAKVANVSEGQVSKLFGTMVQLRRAIMSAAVARNDLIIIAQGIACGEPKAVGLSPDVKRAALEALL